MDINRTVAIGIDIGGARRPFAFAALDFERRLLAIGQGGLEEALVYCAGQSQALVAVNSPSKLNNGSMKNKEVRQAFEPPPPPGRWTNARCVEYQLALLQLDVIRTAAREQDCQTSIQQGFEFYRLLHDCHYQPHSVISEDAPRQWCESHAEGAYRALLGTPPFEYGTLEGRIQRQLALYDQHLPVPDAMNFFEEVTRYRLLHGILPLDDILPAAELNALVAAYTAWLAVFQPEQTQRMGPPEEGEIWLPADRVELPPPARDGRGSTRLFR
jgi:hypothetical protein